MGEREMHTKFLLKNLKVKDYLGHLCVNGRIILKYVSNTVDCSELAIVTMIMNILVSIFHMWVKHNYTNRFLDEVYLQFIVCPNGRQRQYSILKAQYAQVHLQFSWLDNTQPTDQSLTCKRRHPTVNAIQSFRRVKCNTDLYLAVSKLMKKKKTKRVKWDIISGTDTKFRNFSNRCQTMYY